MSGNVIGHFTVPNLRELLTPLTQQVEESIEKEERPGREKQRNVIFLEVIFFIILSEQLFYYYTNISGHIQMCWHGPNSQPQKNT